MFEGIKYRYHLWKLLRKKKRTERIYDEAIKDAKAKSKEDEKQAISEAMFFIDEEDFGIRELYTDHLCYIAKRLIVPLPEFKDESMWQQSFNRYILTPKGIYELKKLIRNEQKEKREIIFSWITLLIGLLGTLIGVISVLK